jgi:hypothetical protein
MQIYNKIPKVTLFIILPIVLFISSCDVNNSNPESYQTASGILTTSVTKTDSIGHFISTIDSSKITNPPIASLDRALTFRVDAKLLKKTVIRFGDNKINSNVVIFFLVKDSNGKVISPSGLYQLGPDAFKHIVHSNPPSGKATFHAFFVNGIGFLPKHPVKINLKFSNDSTKVIQLDPGQFTLPGHFAVHLSKKDMGSLPANWKLGFGFDSNKQAQQKSSNSYLLYVSRINTGKENTFKGFIRSDDVKGLIYYGGKEVSDFDFFVMLLK